MRFPRGGPTNALTCLDAACSGHPCLYFARKERNRQSQKSRRGTREGATLRSRALLVPNRTSKGRCLATNF